MIEMENNKQKIYVVSDDCNCICGGVSPKKVFVNRNVAEEFINDEHKKHNLYYLEVFTLEDTNIIKNKVEEKNNKRIEELENKIKCLEKEMKEKRFIIGDLMRRIELINYVLNSKNENNIDNNKFYYDKYIVT